MALFSKKDLGTLSLFLFLIILAVVIYNLNVWLFFALYGLLFIALALFRFRWALSLFIISIYLNGLSAEIGGNVTIRLDQILLLLSLAIYILFYFQGKLRFFTTPLDRPIVIFLAINLLASLFFSEVPLLTLRKSLLLVLYSLFYFLVANIILNSDEEGDNHLKFFKEFSLAAGAMMLFGLINLFFFFLSNSLLSGTEIVPAEALTPNVPHDVSVSRIFSTMHEPNIFGNIASVFSLIFLGLLFSQLNFSSGQRWIFFFFGLMSMLANFFSYTRGSWLSFIIGCFLIFILRRKINLNRRKIFKYLVILFSIFFVILGASFLIKPDLYVAYAEKIRGLLDYQTGTGRVRLSMWQAVIKDVPSSWLFGHGTQGHLFLFGEDETIGLANFPLDVLHSSGLIGLLVFFWVQFKIVKIAWRRIRETNNQILPSVLGILILSFLAMWVGNFFICVYWLSFPWTFMAIIAAYSLKESSSLEVKLN